MGQSTGIPGQSIDRPIISDQDKLRVATIYSRLQPFVLLCFFLVISVASYELYRLHSNENQTIEIAKSRIEQRTDQTANTLSAYLADIPPLVDELAKYAGSTDNSEETIKPTLETIMRRNNDLFEVGIALEPEANGAKPSPHYGMLNGNLAHFDLSYDYTIKEWYLSALGKTAQWFEPYYGETTRSMVVGYTVPFQQFSNGELRRGVARANLSLHGIRNYLSKMDLGENGYSFVLSKNQRFIYHPVHRFVANKWNLRDAQAQSKTGKFYSQLKRLLDKNHGGIASLPDPISHKSSWVVFAPIPESDWTFISIDIEDELIADTLNQSHLHKVRALILLTIALLLLCLFIGMLFHSKYGYDTAWPTAMGCSITLVIALIVMGAYFNTVENSQRLKTIANIQELDEITAKHHLQKASGGKPPISVPTGVFLQSIEFQSSNNVFITGYVWQRVPTGKITPGIIFPEAVSGSELTQVYSTILGKNTLTGWYFETVFRQPFDYSRYPLDNKNVWIRMWHGTFDENVILVPDLSSYDVSAAELTPGMEADMVLSGWSLIASGFQYVTNSYNSSFGYPLSTPHGNVPELYYTVKLERNFIDAFVTNLVPLIVVSIMLFAILLTITCDKEKAGLFGADAFSVVTTTAGLFFIVVVAHIQLRKEFTLPKIIYLEYFYLVMYIAILWVSIAAFMVTSSKQGQLIHYRDGLFAKIFYWPMILLGLMFVSYNVFI